MLVVHVLAATACTASSLCMHSRAVERLLRLAALHRYRRSLGIALQRMGRTVEALAALEFAVDKDPSDVVVGGGCVDGLSVVCQGDVGCVPGGMYTGECNNTMCLRPGPLTSRGADCVSAHWSTVCLSRTLCDTFTTLSCCKLAPVPCRGWAGAKHYVQFVAFQMLTTTCVVHDAVQSRATLKWPAS
jgi:hypothetical protein